MIRNEDKILILSLLKKSKVRKFEDKILKNFPFLSGDIQVLLHAINTT